MNPGAESCDAENSASRFSPRDGCAPKPEHFVSRDPLNLQIHELGEWLDKGRSGLDWVCRMMTPTPAEIPPTLLRAVGVGRSYAGRAVLKNVSFELLAGERLALTGPSGSGKTTLLNCLGGVDRPDIGRIELGGVALETLDGDALAAVRRRRLGTIFQFFHLLPTLTAAENVELPLQLNGVPTEERMERVRYLLERVQVSHRADARPSELSGGEMQRVAIARALAHRPELLLADEPTGNLDSRNGDNILRLLQELSDETGTALVLVTHSPDAAAICHRELLLRDGEIVGETVRLRP